MSARGHWTKYPGATRNCRFCFRHQVCPRQGDDGQALSIGLLRKTALAFMKTPMFCLLCSPAPEVKEVDIDNDNPLNCKISCSAPCWAPNTWEFFRLATIINTDLVNLKEEQAEDHIKYSPVTEGVTAQVDYTIRNNIDGPVYCYFPSTMSGRSTSGSTMAGWIPSLTMRPITS